VLPKSLDSEGARLHSQDRRKLTELRKDQPTIRVSRKARQGGSLSVLNRR